MFWVTPTHQPKDFGGNVFLTLMKLFYYSMYLFHIHNFDLYQSQNIWHGYPVYDLLSFLNVVKSVVEYEV